MRILFCDVCDESVPQADLDLGRAVKRKGRIVCYSCESAMSPSPGSGASTGSVSERQLSAPHESSTFRGAAVSSRVEPAVRSSSGLAVSLALSSVALLLSAGAVGFLFQELRAESRSIAARLEGQRASAESASRSFEARLEGNMQAALAELAFTEGSLAELDRRLAESKDSRDAALSELREDVVQLERRIARVEVSPRANGSDLQAQTEEREQAQALRADFQELTLRIAELESRPTSGASDPEPAVPAVDPEPEVITPAWLATVADLTSENSSRRWQAVQSLGKTRDVETAEYLIPMLKDPDIFVRMATARILGDLDAALAIPALIDALEDTEASVREASVVSLRSITGRSFKFEPGAKQSDRTRRVRAWRDWWEKAASDYVGKR